MSVTPPSGIRSPWLGGGRGWSVCGPMAHTSVQEPSLPPSGCWLRPTAWPSELGSRQTVGKSCGATGASVILPAGPSVAESHNPSLIPAPSTVELSPVDSVLGTGGSLPSSDPLVLCSHYIDRKRRLAPLIWSPSPVQSFHRQETKTCSPQLIP